MRFAARISVNTRYTRATNVARDRGSLSIVESYLPTARGVELLGDVAATLGAENLPRAWSLVGPYGSGKSSFALFLHELLGGGTSQSKAAALDSLASMSQAVADRFRDQGSWCCAVLSGGDEPIRVRLLAALAEAADRYWRGRPGRKPQLIGRLRQARQRPTTDRDALELADALRLAARSRGGGLLVIVDELGKFLEHEAREDAGGVFLLQELAERAYQGGDGANLMLFVLLHQGFDLYARGMGEARATEWAKVQGRFQSISFIETVEQTLRVVATAIGSSLTEAQRRSVARRAAGLARALHGAHAMPKALGEADGAALFASCYPLHPLSLLVLPLLCQRFAQNERTLFGYLGSREAHGFQDSVQALTRASQWVSPSELYDYFVQNQPAHMADPLTHRRWAEVITAVERAEHQFGAMHQISAGGGGIFSRPC